jgi:hypothetical protein
MTKLQKKDTFQEILKSVVQNFNGSVELISESTHRDRFSIFMESEIKGENHPGILCEYNNGEFELSTYEEGFFGDLFSDGTFEIRYNDADSYPSIMLNLSTPEEVEDLKDFFYYSTDHIDENYYLVDKTEFVKTTMADLIEDVFVPVFLDNTVYLLDLKYILESETELSKTLKGAFGVRNTFQYLLNNLPTPEEFFRKHIKELKKFETFGTNKRDVIFSSLNTASSMSTGDLFHFEITIPSFIIRLKKDVPYSFFRELVLKTTLYSKIEKALHSKTPLEKFMAISFKAPSDRYHRLRYAFTMNSLSQEIRNLSSNLANINSSSPEKVRGEMAGRINKIKELF